MGSTKHVPEILCTESLSHEEILLVIFFFRCLLVHDMTGLETVAWTTIRELLMTRPKVSK